MGPYLQSLVVCVLAWTVLTLIGRHRRQQRRDGTFPMYVHQSGRKWIGGRALWVHDVLAFRGDPAASRERLFWVIEVHRRPPTSDERWWVHHLGGGMVLGTIQLKDGGSVQVAARREHEAELFGPGLIDDSRPVQDGTTVRTPR